MAGVDQATLGRLGELVERLTHSGEPSLDKADLKALKRLCKTSDGAVRAAFAQLFTALEKKHAQIRLSCMQVFAELFPRSHAFRTCLCERFQEVLQLCLGSHEDGKGLPPPRKHANLLRQLALESIHQWHAKFAQGYKPLALGYKFLVDRQNISFADIQARTVAAERRERDKERQRQAALKRKLALVEEELATYRPDIQLTVQQAKAALNIVFPSLTPESPAAHGSKRRRRASSSASQFSFGGSTSGGGVPSEEGGAVDGDEGRVGGSDDDDGDVEGEATAAGGAAGAGVAALQVPQSREELIQALGLGNASYSLEVSLGDGCLQMEEEEGGAAPVAAVLREAQRVLQRKYLPMITKWMSILQQVELADAQARLMALMDLKDDCTAVLDMCKEVGPQPGGSDSDDDDDLEDVEAGGTKPGYEAAPPAASASKPISAADRPRPDSRVVRQRKRRRRTAPSHKMSTAAPEAPPLSLAKHVSAPKFRTRGSGEASGAAAVPASTATKGKHQPGASSAAKEPDLGDQTREALLKLAPVVDYGMDLTYWGREKDIVEPAGVTSLHRFWVAKDHDENEGTKASNLDGLNKRVEYYEREYKAPKWECRAPIQDATGATVRVCRRKDRQSCPFHGPIIPRDENGVPSSDLDSKPDMALLEPAPKGKGKRAGVKGKASKKKSKLINLKKTASTPKTRLAKRTAGVALYSIDPALDKLRADKFHGNWVDPD